MEEIVKETLKCATFKRMGRGGAGCISEGEGYITDIGNIFVKRNPKPQAKVMFEGEFQGLKAILDTGTLRAPKPMAVIDNPEGGALLVMEYIEMTPLHQQAGKLGELLAKMHVQNDRLRTKMENAESSIHEKAAPDSNGSTIEPIRQFGFHCNTCCGAIPHNNDWCDDWQAFFTRQRLQYQIDLLEKERGDREVISLWPQLQQKIPKILKDVDAKPALLHGDLWAGNASETPEGPVVFDCAAFYGHSEYDLAIASMFGGFTREFFTSYHKIIPKAPGFDERLKLYQLFHYLNHWNHFGNGYRGSSLAIMRKLVK